MLGNTFLRFSCLVRLLRLSYWLCCQINCQIIYYVTFITLCNKLQLSCFFLIYLILAWLKHNWIIMLIQHQALLCVTGHTGKVFHVRWSPLKENLLCSGSDDGQVKMFNIELGYLVLVITVGRLSYQSCQIDYRRGFPWH